MSGVTEDTFEVDVSGKKYPCVLSYSGGSVAKPLGVILAHGAGGDLTNGHLPTTASKLADAGYPCVRFTCKPVHLPTRCKVLQAVLEEALQRPEGSGITSWVFAGHSMGSRVAAACSEESHHDVKGCIFFSYPLHPPGKPDQLRDSPLCALPRPLLFVRGTKDTGFSQPEKFQEVLARLKSNYHKVHEVVNGDHSLKVTGGAAANQTAMSEVYESVLSFLAHISTLPSVPRPVKNKDVGDDKHDAEPKASSKVQEKTTKKAKRKAASKTAPRKKAATKQSGKVLKKTKKR